MASFTLDLPTRFVRLRGEMNSNSPMNDTPSEYECLKQGVAHFYGRDGKPLDYAEYARWMQRGHELGYLNCTARLCDCYLLGYGVPRDFERMLELVREMQARRFPLARRFLVQAYARGNGVPLDVEKARNHAFRLLEELAAPVPGVDEDLRFESLLITFARPELKLEVTHRELFLRHARRCVMESQLPERYAYYAYAQLTMVQDSPEPDIRDAAWSELISCLEKGVLDGDGLSMYLMVVVMEGFGYDGQSLPELLTCAAVFQQPEVLADILRLLPLTDECRADIENKFWISCNRGISWLKREQQLPCHICLATSSTKWVWWVCPEPGAGELFPGRCALQLTSTSETEELGELSLRICCSDVDVDERVNLEGSLKPRDTITMDMEELEKAVGRPLGNNLLVELHSGDRYAQMQLDTTQGLSWYYTRAEGVTVPLELWWEKRALGGLVLCVRCKEGTLTRLKLKRLRSGRESKPRTLQQGEVARFGGWSFRSLRPLAKQEELLLICDEWPLTALGLGE